MILDFQKRTRQLQKVRSCLTSERLRTDEVLPHSRSIEGRTHEVDSAYVVVDFPGLLHASTGTALSSHLDNTYLSPVFMYGFRRSTTVISLRTVIVVARSGYLELEGCF